MSEETQAIRDAAVGNSTQHTSQLTELIKISGYLRNISASASFFVVITLLAICLAICGSCVGIGAL